MKNFFLVSSVVMLTMFNVILPATYALEGTYSSGSESSITGSVQSSVTNLTVSTGIDEDNVAGVSDIEGSGLVENFIKGSSLSDSGSYLSGEKGKQEKFEDLNDRIVNSTVLYSVSGDLTDLLDKNLVKSGDEVKISTTSQVGIFHDTGANITYIDTNGKEFKNIGTITFNDGEHEITILDRNLGAENAGRNSDSYGYQFQWGNNYGFKSCNQVDCQTFPGGESTTSTQVNISGYGWNNPYVSPIFVTNFDIWNQGSSGLWNESDESKRQGPCPAGYHIPTVNEWNDLLKNMLTYYTGNGLLPSNIEPSTNGLGYGAIAWGMANVLSNDLLIPYAMMRDKSGKMLDEGWSYFWTTTKLGDTRLYTFKTANDGFGTTRVIRDNVYGDALTIRCFKDTYTEENKPLVLEYETDGGTKIQSQTIPSGEKAFLPGYISHKNGKVLEGRYSDNSYTTKYELDSNSPYLFRDLVMSEDLADENGVVKIYAKWQDPITYDSNAGIVYVDTNGKEFTGIGTITFNDGVHQVTMLDRNLGAKIAGTGVDSYGYQFQWGNNHGFEPCSSSNCSDFPGGEVTSNVQVNASGYGWNNPYINSNFILNYGGIRYTSRGNLWDESDESKRQGPCPAGYHIPTVNEWNDLVKNLLNIYTGNGFVPNDIINQGGFYGVVAFGKGEIISNDLLIPYAGGRNKEGRVYDMGGWSVLGSSSAIGGAKVHVFKSANDGFGLTFDDEYANASALRCFKDTYTEENKPLVLEYETDGGTKIQSQTIPSGEKAFLPGYTTHRDGYIFKGWYSDDSYTTKYELDSNNPYQFRDLVMNENLVDDDGVVKIYAKWHKYISHDTGANVTYIDTNGKEFTGIGTITFDDGEHKFTFLDRNLGAETAGTGLWDGNWNNVYDGYHFQWGNNYGFKACRDFGCTTDFPGGEITTNSLIDASLYSWDNPYVSSGFVVNVEGVWDSSNNANLWNRNEQAERQGPCPAGYHIPSINEWNNLVKYWVSVYTGNGGTFPSWGGVFPDGEVDGELLYGFKGNHSYIQNDFKVGLAGYRGRTGAMQDKGFWAIFGSSTPTNEKDLYTFKISYGGYGVTYMEHVDISHAEGVSIRCFQDTYTGGNEPFTLSYETNGGTKIQSQSIFGGNRGFLPGYTTHKSGAKLLGWFNSEGTLQYEFETGKNTFINLVINDNTKIYAKWGYNVVFQDETGNEIGKIIVAEGDKITIPESLLQTGYTLTLYDEVGNLFDVENSVISGDIELIVKNTINQYTITFDTDGGNNIDPITADYGAEIFVSSPIRNGYIFKGWNPKLPGNMPAENLLVKAIWYKIGYSGKGKTEGNSEINDHGSAGEDGSIENGGGDMGGEINNNDNNLGGYSVEFQNAFRFAKENGITTKDSIQNADMTGKLTRIQMAKMLSQYAINVLGQTPDVTKTIDFRDVPPEKDLSYDNGVTLAYQLGIMGQNMKNRRFRPDDEVTRGEFVTALSRLLFLTSDGEYKNTSKYYFYHMKKLREVGIITVDKPKMKERRGYVMIMLMRSKLD